MLEAIAEWADNKTARLNPHLDDTGRIIIIGEEIPAGNNVGVIISRPDGILYYIFTDVWTDGQLLVAEI